MQIKKEAEISRRVRTRRPKSAQENVFLLLFFRSFWWYEIGRNIWQPPNVVESLKNTSRKHNTRSGGVDRHVKKPGKRDHNPKVDVQRNRFFAVDRKSHGERRFLSQAIVCLLPNHGAVCLPVVRRKLSTWLEKWTAAGRAVWYVNYTRVVIFARSTPLEKRSCAWVGRGCYRRVCYVSLCSKELSDVQWRRAREAATRLGMYSAACNNNDAMIGSADKTKMGEYKLVMKIATRMLNGQKGII